MIQLFNGMQSSLSMVYDRETGNMRTLLVSPFPRWYLLTSKLLAGTAVSILQVYAYLLIAYFWGIEPDSLWGYVTVLPALLLSGLMLGALGHGAVLARAAIGEFCGSDELRHLPDVLRLSALYPLWKVQEGSPWLATVCELNPSTYAVGADPLRAVSAGRLGFARGRFRLPRRVPRRGDLCLRSGARHVDPPRGSRRMSAAIKQKRPGAGRSVCRHLYQAGALFRAVRLELRNIGPDVVPLARLFEPGEEHFDARNIGLRVGDVLLERVVAPGDAEFFIASE